MSTQPSVQHAEICRRAAPALRMYSRRLKGRCTPSYAVYTHSRVFGGQLGAFEICIVGVSQMTLLVFCELFSVCSGYG